MLYMVVGGFIFYLLSILIDPIFIPTLKISDNNECTEFSNKLAEQKYRHNRKMESRRANKMIGLFMAASVVTLLLMVLKPSLFFGSGVKIEDYTGAFATAVFYGIILGFIMPVFYESLLPPPSEWLPAELEEIRTARIELILKKMAD